jgi:protein-disulfide isomerase
MRAIARRTVVLAAAMLALAACNKGGSGGSTDISQDMSLGKADAPVTVIEYASPTCPHCAAFNAETFPAFKAKYVDTGKAKYVLREALIHGEPDAAGYLLARCVPADKYFIVVDQLMRSQKEFFETGDVRAWTMRVGQGAGLSEKQIQDCLGDEKKIQAMSERYQKEMKEYDVQGTPTFIINGKKVADHAMTIDELSAAIDPLLAQPKK